MGDTNYNLHERARAAQDALFIKEGASNSLGVAHALVRAIKAFRVSPEDGKDYTELGNKAPAVKLILHQLCHLAGIGDPLDMTEYLDAIDACEDLLKEANAEKGGQAYVEA